MRRLFEPIALGELNLRNRTVMAPMTRRMSPGGIPPATAAGYYRRRAEGGVALVMTEGLAIDHPTAMHNPNVPDIFGVEAVRAWAAIAREVQGAGAAFIAQLWHTGGARSKFTDVPNPLLPAMLASSVYFPGNPYGEPVSEAEIENAVLSYGRAARTAMEIGFDGIDIHAGHGYLIDGFLWAKTNLRRDGYGGGLADRTCFACEVIAECRRQTRPGFPIFFRFSQFKEQDYEARLCHSPAELEQFLGPLTAAGVDIFDCSTRRFWKPEFEGSDLNLAGWTRKLSGKPVMTVGSVGLETDAIATVHGGERISRPAALGALDRLVERGDFDLVAIGRALISDPAWVAKVKDGRLAELKGFNAADLAALN